MIQLPIDVINGHKKLIKDYYTKNPHNGIELYIGGLTNRFSTFTGDCISGTEELIDCTEGLLTILETKMKKCPQGCDDSADQFVQLGEDDIPQILSDIRKQKNGSKFISLFDEGEIPNKKPQSETNVSLCAIITFRAGPDPDLINSIFKQSASTVPNGIDKIMPLVLLRLALKRAMATFILLLKRA